MPSASSRFTGRHSLVGVAVLAYFVCYPDDLSWLLQPVDKLLSLSNSISPWLYGLIAVWLLAWTFIRIFGPSRRRLSDQ